MECRMNIYIGNMSFKTTEDQLREAFSAFGEVTSVKIITDKYDNRPKGFAFVEMADKEAGLAAISNLNGKEMDGRELNVNQAKPKKESGNRHGKNNYNKMY